MSFGVRRKSDDEGMIPICVYSFADTLIFINSPTTSLKFTNIMTNNLTRLSIAYSSRPSNSTSVTHAYLGSRRQGQRSGDIAESRQEETTLGQITSPSEHAYSPTMDSLVAIMNDPLNDRGDVMEVAASETGISNLQNPSVHSSDDQPSTVPEEMASPESTSTAPPEPHGLANSDGPEYSETSSDSESDDERPTREDFVEDSSTPDAKELEEIESRQEIAGTDRKCLLVFLFCKHASSDK